MIVLTFRGDAHKLYLKLKHFDKKGEALNKTKELDEIQEIRTFYKPLDTHTLKLVYYRMMKEKSGSGIVPIFVTAIPWFIFLFASKLQEFLFHEGSLLWLPFSIIYLILLAISVIIHFREKAWATVHIEIIQDIIKERKTHSSTPV